MVNSNVLLNSFHMHKAHVKQIQQNGGGLKSGCITIMSMSNTLTIRLPEELNHWLESEARLTGIAKGRIVREQLELLRTKTMRQPFLDLAGSIEGTPELSTKRGFVQ